MPPKKQQKQNEPKKPKADLTFGLKNKNKSAKVQKQVQILQQQASAKGVNKETKAKEAEKDALAKKKEAERKHKAELAELFSVEIVQPKVPFGVDPKTVLCAYFKAGKCQKGNKCKYSHDLNAERKSAKASIYADQRDGEKEQEKDTMDNWDEAKLREVVERKGRGGGPVTTTDIVCKFFIDAVEQSRYGWFWQCPNGEDCKYRHALPPGFVLKSQKKKEEEDAKKNEITLEEFLEVERHKLDHSKLTPVTKESFAKWKETRVSAKEAQAQAERDAKSAAATMGKAKGLSGRDFFTFNPDFVLDSDDEEDGGDDGWDIDALRAEKEKEWEEQESERIRKLNLNDSSTGAA